MRSRIRNALLVAMVVLYALSVPWFREPGASAEVWLGLPDWTTTSLLCFVGVAIANALAWLLVDLRDEEVEGPRNPDEGRAR